MNRKTQLRSKEVITLSSSNLAGHITALLSVLMTCFGNVSVNCSIIQKTQGDQDGKGPWKFVCMCVLSHFSCIWLFATPWTILGILQARILGLPCPPPGDLPNPGIEPASLTSPELAGGSFTTGATWEAHWKFNSNLFNLIIFLFINQQTKFMKCLLDWNHCQGNKGRIVSWQQQN